MLRTHWDHPQRFSRLRLFAYLYPSSPMKSITTSQWYYLLEKTSKYRRRHFSYPPMSWFRKIIKKGARAGVFAPEDSSGMQGVAFSEYVRQQVCTGQHYVGANVACSEDRSSFRAKEARRGHFLSEPHKQIDSRTQQRLRWTGAWMLILQATGAVRTCQYRRCAL